MRVTVFKCDSCGLVAEDTSSLVTVYPAGRLAEPKHMCGDCYTDLRKYLSLVNIVSVESMTEGRHYLHIRS